MADFMRSGEPSVLIRDLLSDDDTPFFAINESGGLDRHDLSSNR